MAFDFAVERGIGDAIHGGGVTQFLEEWCLIIETCCDAEGHVLIERWDDAQRDARADDRLLVEVPMAESDTIIQCEQGGGYLAFPILIAFISPHAEAVSVLDIGLDTVGFQFIFCP